MSSSEASSGRVSRSLKTSCFAFAMSFSLLYRRYSRDHPFFLGVSCRSTKSALTAADPRQQIHPVAPRGCNRAARLHPVDSQAVGRETKMGPSYDLGPHLERFQARRVRTRRLEMEDEIAREAQRAAADPDLGGPVAVAGVVEEDVVGRLAPPVGQRRAGVHGDAMARESRGQGRERLTGTGCAGASGS